MTEENKASLWRARLKTDSPKFPRDQKVGLVKGLLCHLSGLTEEEADVFTDLSETPHDPTSEVAPIYDRAEQKVGDSYGGAAPDLWTTQSEPFKRELRTFLQTVYPPHEIDELFTMVIRPIDCDLIVRDVIGSDDQLIRRIRNAYLPIITDVLSYNPNTNLVTDITKKVFSGPGDAVSQIERLFGITKAKARAKIFPKESENN